MSGMVERVARAIQAAVMLTNDECLDAARAAIEAMRTPTFPMVKAQTLVAPAVADFIWCAMIDAALAEQP